MKRYVFWFLVGVWIGAMIALLDGCCPGARNLAYPQSRTAFDFMNYDQCSKECVLSKMDRYMESNNMRDWICTVNQDDEMICTFDGQAFDYFRLLHTGNKEQSNELWQWYMSKLRGHPNFQLVTNYSLSVTYYRWNVRVTLTSFGTQVTGTRI